jgi:NTP pyrophosphatase (non-canonical NTP hydrolase)
MKVNEEVAEIGREIIRGNYDKDELSDAIGDSLITLIILSDLLGMNPIDNLEQAYKEIRGRTGKVIEGSFVKGGE